MNTLHTTNTVLAKSDLLELKGRQLHQKLMKAIFFFGLVYTGINIATGMYSHAYATFSLPVGMVLSHYLDKKEKVLLSKIWTFFVINAALFVMAFLSIQNVYVYLFYFPIAIGAYIVFLGKDKLYSYLFSIISLFGMTVIVAFEFKGWSILGIDDANPALERLLNVFGTFFFLMIEAVFLVRLNEDIQTNLLASQRTLDLTVSQLKSSVYSRDRIMSMLAHDIRTPLSGIYGFLDIIDTNSMDEKAVANLKKSIKERSDATIEMVNDILRWSMSQSSTISFHPKPMGSKEVCELFQTVCKPYEDHLKTKEIEILPVDLENFKVDIDRIMMESIFRNLLSNALKFNPIHRKIVFRARLLDNGVEFSVRDNGKGISEENIALILAGNGFSVVGVGDEKGIGLGTQIVLDFLQFHHSSLQISSSPENGSKFYFVLPLSESLDISGS